jgi:hypothetical protein
MDPIAQYALTGSIVASALGGMALCALVILYGFWPAEDESATDAHRRIYALRLGHTAAAVCFAATAVLAVVALTRYAGSVAGSQAASDIGALESRVRAMEQLVERIAGSMEALVSRIERGERVSASPATAAPGGKTNPAR